MKPRKPIARYKTGTCLTCGKQNAKLTAGRCIESPYCYKRHRAEQSATKGTKSLKSPKKHIKPISDKRAKLNAIYNVAAAQFKKDNPVCQCQVKCNGDPTEDVHHKKGRGEYLLDVATYLATCRACHQYIETHVKWAKENGFSEDRL